MENDYQRRISDAFTMATQPNPAAALEPDKTGNNAAVSLLRAAIEQIIATYPDDDRRTQAVACIIYAGWFLTRAAEKRRP